ncbi:MAG: helix-turn-helix transcriptional regulator [Treponema sp.]|nr:helix-turn-helix transcriptional regulator [Candidatus Treponema caballi]
MADSNTRECILKMSVEMFSSMGYNAVSIRDIAGAVKIRESSVYYHFKSRKDIHQCPVWC